MLFTEIGEEVAGLLSKVSHSENIGARYQPHLKPGEVIEGEAPGFVFIACFAPSELGALLAGLRVLKELAADFACPTAAECGADHMAHGYGEAIDCCCRQLGEMVAS